MEESYETFEEDLGPRDLILNTSLLDPHVDQAPPPQSLRAEPKSLPREPTLPPTASLQKASSIQNLSPVETPWENVTLNRCLLVAITILVLTSGFQRLNESLHGREDVEDEDAGLTVRHSSSLRNRHRMEIQTSLWDLMLMWLPDFDDDDEDEDDDGDDEEEDEDEEVKRSKPTKGEKSRSSLRNKELPSKKLMKKKEEKLKERKEEKETRGRVSEDEDEDEDEQDVPQKTVQPEKKKKKEKKKTPKE